MSRPLDKLQTEVLELSTSERAKLARFLIASLDEEPADDSAEIEKAWETEIYRRLEEIRSGKAKLIPAADVFAELRKRHG